MTNPVNKQVEYKPRRGYIVGYSLYYEVLYSCCVLLRAEATRKTYDQVDPPARLAILRQPW